MLEPEQARKIAERLVERGIKAGATAADALYAGERSSGVQVRLGELEGVSRSEGEGIGLRLFAGRQSATAASSDLSDEALAALVDRCLAMPRIGSLGDGNTDTNCREQRGETRSNGDKHARPHTGDSIVEADPQQHE